MLRLACAGYELETDPDRGGSILRFAWQGEPVLRETAGPGILDAACFALVPWSNRIARGRFTWDGREIVLPPNCREADPVHPLHGLGWLASWDVQRAKDSSAILEFEHEAGAWPWRFRARQQFELSREGLRLGLSVTNLDDSAMPAGLGLHPYFPCTGTTVYRGLHRGKWHNSRDCLPQRLEEHGPARDWWDGAPVAAMPLDTVFTGREGPLEVRWPERGLAVTLTPSPLLAFTAVYVPEDTGWFCVEPVSHNTDAVNSGRADSGLRSLAPGETLTVSAVFQASLLAPGSG